MAKKAMLGHKVRRLRSEHSITQAEMARRLGISPSYLNLIENNQRPVTVDMLLRLGQTFDVDLHAFAEDDGARLMADVQEVFADPLFEGAGLGGQDIVDLVNAAPAPAGALLSLYRAYRKTTEDLRQIAERGAGGQNGAEPAPPPPLEQVHDFLHTNLHYFPELETAAEEIWQSGMLESDDLPQGLSRYLDEELHIRVKVMPLEVMGTARRRFDRHGRRLLLSEMLEQPSRNFQLAVQIAYLRYRDLLDRLVADAGFASADAARLARICLANYLAGALLMPYGRFYRAATAVRYDIEILRQRFAASVEQVCVRLTTLQRPGSRGVPFFLIRVDKAGNISKRLSASALPFARLGGACPRWNLHDAFRWPRRIHTQVSEMPDGQRIFSLSRTVDKAGAGYRHPGQTFAIALGCDITYAAQLVYADGVDLTSEDVAVPVGLHCRVCPRLDCSQRAFPPVHHELMLDENVRGATPYIMQPRPS